MTYTWRKRSAGRSCRGKGRAAVEYAAQKITSDHRNILPLGFWASHFSSLLPEGRRLEHRRSTAISVSLARLGLRARPPMFSVFFRKSAGRSYGGRENRRSLFLEQKNLAPSQCVLRRRYSLLTAAIGSILVARSAGR